MLTRFPKSSLFILALLVVTSMPALAGPVPSKTAANQSLEARDQDLTTIRNIAATDEVASVLRAHGFTQQDIDNRLAQLSTQDLNQLAQNIEQVQAAGLTRQEWLWVGIGAALALIIIVAVA